MTTRRLFAPFLLLLFALTASVSAQNLTVVSGQPVQDYVYNFVDTTGGLNVFNIQLQGDADQIGEFTNPNPIPEFDMAGGLILSSGDVADAPGPNSQGNISTNHGNFTQDPELDAILNVNMRDRVFLQFDFIPKGDSISFDYIFASDEYNEFVNAGFNDAFGFFIQGPGFPTFTNIALLPAPPIPVTIDNVNNGNNPGYYIDNANNPFPVNIEYDGLTVKLRAAAEVTPCSTYTFKIALCDAGDGAYDSGVFLQEGSFKQNAVAGNVTGQTDTLGNVFAYEGCTDAGFEVYPQSFTGPQDTIALTYTGNAVSGVDFVPLPDEVIFTAPDDTVFIPFEPLFDGITEGVDTVRLLSIEDDICGTPDTLVLEIQIYDTDSFSLDLPDTVRACEGDIISVSPNNFSGGVPGLQNYVWTNTGDTIGITPFLDDVFVDSVQTWTLTMSDACNTPVKADSLVVETDDLEIEPDSLDPSCFNGSDGQAIVNVLQGNHPPFSYSWNTAPPQVTDTASGLPQGSYQVVVTDDQSCTDTAEVNLQHPPELTLSTDTVDVSCNGGSDGEAIVSASGGTAPYSYSWNTVPPQTTDTATGLPAGSYTVTVTDDQGCTETATVQVNEPPALGVSIVNTPETCSGSADGTAVATPNGGTPPYSYSWNTTPPQLSDTATGLTAGTYTVTVTDSLGCVFEDSTTVTPTTEIFVTATSTDVSCHSGADGTLDVSAVGGTPPYSYSWNTTPPQTTASVTGVSAGSYTITVTDDNGCFKDTTVVVDEPDTLTSTMQGTDPLCNGDTNGSAYVTAGGGTPPYSYSWNTTPPQVTDTASGLSAGDYIVTITDDNGCILQDTITLTDPPVVTASILSIDSVSCFGLSDGTAVAEGNGGTGSLSFSWNTTPPQLNDTATGLAAGTYTVTVTDSFNCSATADTTIESPADIDLSQSTTGTTCNGGSDGSATVVVNTGGTAPYTYSWNTTPPQTTATITSLSAGDYTATVTDFNGCQDSIQATVTEPAPITVGFTPQMPDCNGGSNGTLTANPGNGTAPFTYSWNTTPPQTGQTATGLSAGDYELTVTDDLGCTVVDTGTVGEPTAVQANATGTNPVCGGVPTGTAAANASGGTPLINGGNEIYFYSWNTNPPVGFQQLINLGPGDYVVTVTDGNGCTDVDTVTLTAPPAIVIDTVAIDPVSCHSGADGELSGQAAGGSPPYTYSWNTVPVQTGQTITGLIAGNYTLTVTDTNNCSTDTTVNLPQPAPISATFTKTNVACFGEDGGSATVASISGGTPASNGYEIEWSTTPPVTGQSNIGNLLAGDYTVTITDSLGCSWVRDFTITQPDPIVLALDVDSVTCANGDDGMMTAFVSGGVPPYSYLWSTGSTEQGIDSLLPGTYGVSITDANGCPDTAEATVFAPDPLQATVQTTDVTCFGGDDGSAEVFPTGGTPPYNYVWVVYPDQQYTKVATNLRQDSMYVKVFDNSGCRRDIKFYIDAPDPVEVAIDAPDTRACAGQVLTFEASTTGGTPGYTIEWTSQPAGFTTTGAIAAINAPQDTTWYFARATDSQGCTGLDSVRASSDPNATASFEVEPVTACDSAYISINNTSSSAIGFQWDLGNGTTTTVPEPSQAYTEEGTYSIELIAISPSGCTDTMFMPDVVTIYRSAVAGFTAEPTREEEIQLLNATINFTNNSTDATSYAWDFGDGTTSNVASPQHTYQEPGEYFVELVVDNELGCGDTVRYGPYRINVPSIQVPNVFTPDGDGINDRFRIITEGIERGKLWIFDRWGREIYSGNQLEWDGNTAEGQPAAEGVYFFKLEATAIDGVEFTDDGNVTLVR